MTVPIKQVIPRDIPENIKPTIEWFANLLDEVVNFGSNILIWDEKPKTDGDENIPPTMLFRHFLDLIDSTSILTRHATGDTTKLLVRAAFETSLFLEYLFEKDTLNRSMAFLVADSLKLIKKINKLNPKTQEGEKTHKVFKEEALLTSISDSELEEFNDFIKSKKELLSEPQYKIAYEEYLKLERQGFKNPNWYRYFDGPSNIEGLSKYLNQWSIYEIMYRKWSGSVHGTDIYLGKIMATEDPGKVDIVQLRYVKDLQEVVSYSLILSFKVFRLFISHRIPHKIDDYFSWYFHHKHHLEKLTSKQFIEIS